MPCTNCDKTSPEEAADVRVCGNCHSTPYCSRECQRADWRSHKTICTGRNGNGTKQDEQDSGPSSSPSSSKPSRGLLFHPRSPLFPARSPRLGANRPISLPLTKNLDTPIPDPFTRLDNGTWLHDRSERDVYTLLIDAYRMRIEDEYRYDGKVDSDSIYAGNDDSSVGFSRFLEKVERHDGGKLLPKWWGPENREKCLRFGKAGEGEDDSHWARLDSAVDKAEVNEHYGNDKFAMQLRMFAEPVYGHGPGGSDGTTTRKMMVMMETDGL